MRSPQRKPCGCAGNVDQNWESTFTGREETYQTEHVDTKSKTNQGIESWRQSEFKEIERPQPVKRFAYVETGEDLDS